MLDSRGRQHAIKVATGVYGSSRDIAALGLGCDEPSEIYEKWRQALAKPIEPQVIASAPVQEIVYMDSALSRFGLTSLPAPVEEPGKRSFQSLTCRGDRYHEYPSLVRTRLQEHLVAAFVLATCRKFTADKLVGIHSARCL